MSKYRLTEKKFISKYLAQRFIGEEASEDECDKEAEFILEYITQSLLATATPEELKEEIATEICTYCDKNSQDTCHSVRPCAASLKTAIDILTKCQRSTAQAVDKWEEFVKEKDNEISQLKGELNARYLKDKEEVWYWLGDSNDHLESLCCPILIQPEDMRQVVKEAVINAKKEERERIRQEFNKRNAPDAKDWQTGTGGKLYKVLLFTKKEWCDFWQALKSEEG